MAGAPQGRRSYKAAITGRRNRDNGLQFEELIEAACRYYSITRKAEIEKTPEPVRQLGPKSPDGHFTACYLKKAQPDYKGTLAGGKAVVFEAKHTDTDRLLQSAVTEEQATRLDRHMALGAECFVLVSFSFREFFRVPWAVFREMKAHFGHKYITAAEAQPFKIRYSGALRFLEGGENKC